MNENIEKSIKDKVLKESQIGKWLGKIGDVKLIGDINSRAIENAWKNDLDMTEKLTREEEDKATAKIQKGLILRLFAYLESTQLMKKDSIELTPEEIGIFKDVLEQEIAIVKSNIDEESNPKLEASWRKDLKEDKALLKKLSNVSNECLSQRNSEVIRE